MTPRSSEARSPRLVSLFGLLIFAGLSPLLTAQSGSGGGGGSGGSGSGDGGGGSGSGSGGEIPTGGLPSPRFGAQPFTQKLLLFEEFGTDPLPSNYQPGNALPSVRDRSSCPDGSLLDAFLAQPLFPAATRAADELYENPWRAQIEQMLG